MLQRYKKMFNYQRLMFNAPITPIQNSEFKIQNSSQRRFSEGSAKDERRMSEGSAKESRRAGAAEYVTKNKSLCGSHRRKVGELAQPSM